MKKSELVRIIAEVKRQRDAGEISQQQYDRFMDRVRGKFIYLLLEDPVWEKPQRPVSKPRAHKRGAYLKDLHT